MNSHPKDSATRDRDRLASFMRLCQRRGFTLAETKNILGTFKFDKDLINEASLYLEKKSSNEGISPSDRARPEIKKASSANGEIRRKFAEGVELQTMPYMRNPLFRNKMSQSNGMMAFTPPSAVAPSVAAATEKSRTDIAGPRSWLLRSRKAVYLGVTVALLALAIVSLQGGSAQKPEPNRTIANTSQSSDGQH